MTISLLKLLRNQIDITRVPFSDRGSRLLVNQYPEQSRLNIKLAERLTSLGEYKLFFVEALQKVGELDLSRELRDKTLNLIMDQPGIHEYYNPGTGQPPATSANMFGWTAAVFIELAIQATADLNSTIL